MRSAGSAEYRLPHTGATKYLDDVPKIPAGAVTAEDADLLANLAPQGPVRMHLVLTPQILPDVESYNVVADLKGSKNPEQVVISSRPVTSATRLRVVLASGGGQAIRIRPTISQRGRLPFVRCPPDSRLT